MTMKEIQDALERASEYPDGRKRNACILRPCSVSTLIELDAELVRKAFKQIQTTITAVSCGVSDPKSHAAETLLLQIFQQHAENFGGW